MFTLSLLSQWIPATPTGYIIAGILAVLLIYLGYWLVYASVKLSLWLTSEILRATFFSLAVMFYTLWVVFVSAPIRLAIRKESLGSVSDQFGKNVKMTLFIFYPKLKKGCNKNTKKTITHTIDSRGNEITVETEISKYSSISNASADMTVRVQDKSKYFCTNCGENFTNSMIHTLNVKGYTFCEGCGKRFQLENDIPAPMN